MKNSNKSFEITIIAILSALNSAVELTLGSYLHIIKFPMVGSLMVGINVIIYTIGYSAVPRKGTVVSMGIITAFLNLVLGGSFKPWAILAIIAEALIIELIIMVLGFNFWSIVSASIAVNMFTLIYPLATMGIIMGKGVMNTAIEIFSGLIPNKDWVRASLIMAAIVISIFHFLLGTVFGILSWKVNNWSYALNLARGTTSSSQIE